MAELTLKDGKVIKGTVEEINRFLANPDIPLDVENWHWSESRGQWLNMWSMNMAYLFNAMAKKARWGVTANLYATPFEALKTVILNSIRSIIVRKYMSVFLHRVFSADTWKD